MINRCRAWACWGLLWIIFGLGGCQVGVGDVAVVEKPADLLVGDFVAGHNANVDRLQDLNIYSQLVVEEVKADGQMEINQLDVNIDLSLPHKMVIFIKKVSQDLYWLGCDEKHYWGIDLYAKKRHAFVGRNGVAVKAGRGRVVFPATPHDMIDLLGYSKLKWAGVSDKPAVLEYMDGGAGMRGFVFESMDGRRRYLIDPKTRVVLRIDLLDKQGYSRVTCRLKGHERVDVYGVAGEDPLLAMVYVIRGVGKAGSLVLRVDSVSSRKGKSKAIFEMAKVMKRYRVRADQIVDLNQ